MTWIYLSSASPDTRRDIPVGFFNQSVERLVSQPILSPFQVVLCSITTQGESDHLGDTVILLSHAYGKVTKIHTELLPVLAFLQYNVTLGQYTVTSSAVVNWTAGVSYHHQQVDFSIADLTGRILIDRIETLTVVLKTL